jgi:hypothetical protein
MLIFQASEASGKYRKDNAASLGKGDDGGTLIDTGNVNPCIKD